MYEQGCTLDAAGKIYSCRVDSVHNDTFRVVHGLGRVGDGQEGEEEEEKVEGEDAEGGESDEEGESKKKAKKAAPTRSSTIENNPDALLQKKLDTESNVDPLFQKMCKAFDEGGARGMLLNQVAALGALVLAGVWGGRSNTCSRRCIRSHCSSSGCSKAQGMRVHTGMVCIV